MIAPHLLGQKCDHVQKDVVVIGIGQPDLSAAFNGYNAVLQLVPDHADTLSFAEREGCDIHQVDVVFERRV